jgi:hypothetical protein
MVVVQQHPLPLVRMADIYQSCKDLDTLPFQAI